jgi:GntR family transcriptional regulator, transcriptional repressor for pyruvate dehydrogenase complex
MATSEKLAFVVARAIVDQVAEDGLRAGDALGTEPEMTRRYGVSRGTLRESLRILEVLGVITLKRGPTGGPILLEADVAHFSQFAKLQYQRLGVTYEELLTMRVILEPAAAALCAGHASEGDGTKLRAYLYEAGRIDVSDDRQFRSVGQGFHQLVAEMSGNQLLNLVASSCYDVFAGRASHFVYPTSRRHHVLVAHEEIAIAILDHDADKARVSMESHMREYAGQAAAQFRGLIRETVRW